MVIESPLVRILQAFKAAEYLAAPDRVGLDDFKFLLRLDASAKLTSVPILINRTAAQVARVFLLVKIHVLTVNSGTDGLQVQNRKSHPARYASVR